MFHLHILLHYTVQSIRNKVHDYIQVDFIWLLSIGIEELAHLDTVRMVQGLQDFKFTVLVSFVLENFLDSYCLSSLSDSRLKYDTKRTISHNFLCVVS